MGRGEGADTLELRKRALIVESTLNRVAFQADWQNLRAATAWVGSTARTAQQYKPWLLLVAPLAGLLVARSARRPEGMLRRLLSVLKWIRPLVSLWGSLAAVTGGSAQPKLSPADGRR
jgi:hypothetical protein